MVKGTRKKAMQLRVESVSRKPSIVSSSCTPFGSAVSGTMLRCSYGTACWHAAKGYGFSQKRQTATPWAGARSAVSIGNPQSGQ